MTSLIKPRTEREILMYAFRYALTRNSMAILTVTDALKDAWPKLAEWDKNNYIQEILEEFERSTMDSTSKAHWRCFLEEIGNVTR